MVKKFPELFDVTSSTVIFESFEVQDYYKLLNSVLRDTRKVSTLDLERLSRLASLQYGALMFIQKPKPVYLDTLSGLNVVEPSDMLHVLLTVILKSDLHTHPSEIWNVYREALYDLIILLQSLEPEMVGKVLTLLEFKGVMKYSLIRFMIAGDNTVKPVSLDFIYSYMISMKAVNYTLFCNLFGTVIEALGSDLNLHDYKWLSLVVETGMFTKAEIGVRKLISSSYDGKDGPRKSSGWLEKQMSPYVVAPKIDDVNYLLDDENRVVDEEKFFSHFFSPAENTIVDSLVESLFAELQRVYSTNYRLDNLSNFRMRVGLLNQQITFFASLRHKMRFAVLYKTLKTISNLRTSQVDAEFDKHEITKTLLQGLLTSTPVGWRHILMVMPSVRDIHFNLQHLIYSSHGLSGYKLKEFEVREMIRLKILHDLREDMVSGGPTVQEVRQLKEWLRPFKGNVNDETLEVLLDSGYVDFAVDHLNVYDWYRRKYDIASAIPDAWILKMLNGFREKSITDDMVSKI